MEIRETIQNYLHGDSRTMQIATVDGDQPWICTVWFVADDDLSLYWLSLPSRRHSQELAKNSKVAAAIVIKQQMPTIGLQIQGRAEQVQDLADVDKVMNKYVAKYGEGKLFYSRLEAGTNKHAMYRLRPEVISLIDDVNFPGRGKIDYEL